MSRKQPSPSGGTGNRRRAIGAAGALIGVGILTWLALRGGNEGQPEKEANRLPLIPREAPQEAALPPPPSPEELDERARAALAEWRNAILTRDAEMVVKLDMAFLEAPDMFLAGLKTSAGSDANERVRAFATRQLGKFKRVELAPTFQQLLDDKSPYVRKNAAWALGELAVLDDGRAAARNAKTGLRQLVRRDPVEDVRAAARAALERIQ